MTFKHIKFEDSPIMRSLEKVAKEKGLVKEPTVLEKIASRPAVKKVDTTPSSSMMDNIFKLCAGMRKQGLVKEAAELESNYFNYKQAQTLYEAHKETGEDVIQFAHPKGSHKLEGVEGDEATVEDILDKHVKFLNMVEKKPTGKLSSSAHVLSEVKRALGQIQAPKESRSDLYASLNERLGKIIPLIGATLIILKTDGGDDYDKETADEGAKQMRAAVATRPFDRAALREMQAGLSKIQSTNESGNFKTHNWFGSPDSDDPGLAAWNARAGGQLGALVNAVNGLGRVLTKLENISALEQTGQYQDAGGGVGGSKKSSLVARLGALGRNLNYYKSILQARLAPRAIPQAQSIIQNYQSQVTALNTLLSDKGTTEAEAAGKEAEVKQLEDWVNGFATSWRLASGSPPPTPVAAK